MLTLKNYQKAALETLGDFFRRSRAMDPAQAFREVLTDRGQPRIPAYTDMFAGAPCVCLRLPTGGGKTLLGAYVVAEAGKRLLDTEAPVALWLTPTDTIFHQTLQALNDPRHPYRIALNGLFPQGVRVCDLGDLQTVARQEMGRSAVVIVATMQSFRVEDTSKRNVYAFREDLSPHFEGLPKAAEDRLEKVTQEDTQAQRYLTAADIGRVKHSVANWLALHRPVVIVDEAHNARTDNTFTSLKRLHPACVVELTATPVGGSNVLYHVSAQELKAEDMIKLPIVLFEHPTDWKDAVKAAIQRRAQLDTLAQSEPDYIRPLVLFQAQPKNEDVTVDVLRNHLVSAEEVPENQIAVVTGTQKELDGINLFDRQCPTRYVITVEALKEGWDCSFAYVLCSLQEIRSAKDIEQLLGRVLRMPYARSRQHPELNRAYAHVIAASAAEAAQALTDRMVQNMGFEAHEVAAALTTQESLLGGEDTGDARQIRLIQSTSFDLPKAPLLDSLLQDVRDRVQVHPTTQGVSVTVQGEVPDELLEAMALVVPRAQQEGLRRHVAVHNAQVQAQLAPAKRGVQLAPFPQLCLQLDGQWQVVDGALLAEIGQWDLLTTSVRLDGFALRETARGYEIDVNNRKIFYTRLDDAEQLALDQIPTGVSEQDLVYWLNPQTRQDDVPHAKLTAFLTQCVAHLMRDSQMPLEGLWRCKHQLADAINNEIGRRRDLAADKGFQKFLPGMTCVEEDGQFDHAWRFNPDTYPRREPVYSGHRRFPKHLCQPISDLKSEGEEFDCAVAIDGLNSVKTWVRNIDRHPGSFKFRYGAANFYPDFVAELNDGRRLVVEYKGDNLVPGMTEKNQVGHQWEQTSGGRCLYIMAVKEDNRGRNVLKQLEDKIAGVR
jgi:type III restriction enzyme